RERRRIAGGDRLATRLRRDGRRGLNGENRGVGRGAAHRIGEDGLVLIAAHRLGDVVERQRGRGGPADGGECTAAVGADLPLHRRRGIPTRCGRERRRVAGGDRRAVRLRGDGRGIVYGESRWVRRGAARGVGEHSL